jgi:hypothetical protein
VLLVIGTYGINMILLAIVSDSFLLIDVESEAKQRIYDILKNNNNKNKEVYYEESIGHGYTVIGRMRISSDKRLTIEFREFDYSDHYESKKYDFIIGYNKLILPEATKVYTPDPLYY